MSKYIKKWEREVENWKRVRSAIEHENNLINNRLTWLFTGQGFLFTAFVLAFNVFNQLQCPNNEITFKYIVLSTIIALIGIAISVFVDNGVKAADAQIWGLDMWWHDYKNNNNKGENLQDIDIYKTKRPDLAKEKEELHPPLQRVDSGDKGDIPFHRIPIITIIGWICILLFVWGPFLFRYLFIINY